MSTHLLTFTARGTLGYLVAMAMLNPSNALAAEPQGWDRAAAIVARVRPPTFPDRTVDITRHGAKGDGTTDCRPAITAAIAACAQAGGGRVLVPAGTFLCNGPIHLLSNVNLHLDQGATIRFGTNPDDYLVGEASRGGGVLVRWEGTRCFNYSPLVYAFQQTNIAVTGAGTLDGQTGQGWAAWKKQQTPAQNRLRAMGQQGVPVEQRVFGKGSFLRPTLFGPYDCTNVLIEGVTVKASPFWTLHPVLCRNVLIRNVTVEPGTTNDDGCDPESCTDVVIEGCTFDTRDDNIALKAGRDNDAWAENGGKPCENVVIRNCTFRSGEPGGVSLGSEMSGDIRHVFVERCTMKRVDYAVYAKSNPERGGVIEHLWVRDLAVEECGILLKLEMNYKNKTTGGHPPTFRAFTLERVTCAKATKTALECIGLADSPVKDVTLKQVTVTSAPAAARAARFEYVEGLRLEQVTVNGQPVTAPGK